jgi:protease I
MKRAVIITGPGFEDPEFIYPYYRLQEENFAVDVATYDNKDAVGFRGWPISPSIKLGDLQTSKYELLIIPGGREAPDRVRQVVEILNFTKEMFDQGKIVSSICHGPWVLISAGIMRGKKATCYWGIKDDLINAGAIYLEDPAVIDGNLVTSPHYKWNADWMRATLSLFK